MKPEKQFQFELESTLTDLTSNANTSWRSNVFNSGGAVYAAK